MNLEKQPCKVIDCIVNPDICHQLKTDKSKELLHFFREMLTSYIFQKHKIELNPSDFKIPKLQYKGNYIDFQRVRGKKNPKIEIVGEKVDTNYNDRRKEEEKLRESVIRNEVKIKSPKWKLQLMAADEEEKLMEFDGFNFNREEAKGFLIEVELPLMTTGKFFNLRASLTVIHLRCGRFYELNLTIPIPFDNQNINAFFNVETRVLSLSVDFKKVKEDSESEEEQETENIIQINEQKIKKKGIKIESNLLSDLV